jgi:Tol biopolymer transport system component
MKIVPVLDALLTAALLTAFASGSTAAPSSGRILFSHSEPRGSPTPYIVNADGSGLRPVATAPPGAGEFLGGRWSPNGELLALNYRAGLYLAAADGSSPRRLAAGSIEDFSWSPDSTRIVFTKTVLNKGLRQLYLVSVHGSPHLFTKAPYGGMAWRASWSPDGRTIAFVGVPAVTQVDKLWVIHPDGSGKRQLAARKAISGVPSWSADSRWIAYGAFTAFARDVYLLRRDGRSGETLTHTSDVESEPLFAPVGTGIAYVATEATMDIVFHRTIAAPRETIDDPTWFHGPLVWSPNGTQIATHCFNGSQDTLCLATPDRPGSTPIVSGDNVPLDWTK